MTYSILSPYNIKPEFLTSELPLSASSLEYFVPVEGHLREAQWTALLSSWWGLWGPYLRILRPWKGCASTRQESWWMWGSPGLSSLHPASGAVKKSKTYFPQHLACLSSSHTHLGQLHFPNVSDFSGLCDLHFFCEPGLLTSPRKFKVFQLFFLFCILRQGFSLGLEPVLELPLVD